MDRSRSIQANSGSAAASIMTPPVVTHCTSFLAANRSRLKTQQLQNRVKAAQQAEAASQRPFKMERFKHVGPAIGRALEQQREESRGKERKFLKKNEGKSVVKRGVNAAVGEKLEQEQRAYTYRADDHELDDESAGEQEVDDREEEDNSIYSSAPQSSSSSLRSLPLRLSHEQEEKQSLSSVSHSPPLSSRSYASAAPSAASSSSQLKNFIAANALSVIHTTPPSTQPAPEPSPLHSAYGRVPLYLQQRKAEAEEKRERAREEKAARSVPAGMRRVGEEEREATLARLRQSREEAERQLMRLPLRCETVSRKRQKEEAEHRLQDIEDAIALFSKKIVYITLD
jgi:hypothetical protein